MAQWHRRMSTAKDIERNLKRPTGVGTEPPESTSAQVLTHGGLWYTSAVGQGPSQRDWVAVVSLNPILLPGGTFICTISFEPVTTSYDTFLFSLFRWGNWGSRNDLGPLLIRGPELVCVPLCLMPCGCWAKPFSSELNLAPSNSWFLYLRSMYLAGLGGGHL